MNEFLTALGLVAVIEGLVLVLAPSRFENLIRAIESMNHDTSIRFDGDYTTLKCHPSKERRELTKSVGLDELKHSLPRKKIKF